MPEAEGKTGAEGAPVVGPASGGQAAAEAAAKEAAAETADAEAAKAKGAEQGAHTGDLGSGGAEPGAGSSDGNGKAMLVGDGEDEDLEDIGALWGSNDKAAPPGVPSPPDPHPGQRPPKKLKPIGGARTLGPTIMSGGAVPQSVIALKGS